MKEWRFRNKAKRSPDSTTSILIQPCLRKENSHGKKANIIHGTQHGRLVHKQEINTFNLISISLQKECNLNSHRLYSMHSS